MATVDSAAAAAAVAATAAAAAAPFAASRRTVGSASSSSSTSSTLNTHCISFSCASPSSSCAAAVGSANTMPMRHHNAETDSADDVVAAAQPNSLTSAQMPHVEVEPSRSATLERRLADMHVAPESISTGSRSSSVCSIIVSTPTTPLSEAAIDIVDEDLNEAQHATAAASASSFSCSLHLAGGVGGGCGGGGKPIYPNVPYSPYGSPYGSPRGRKRQPFRESRRISIEHNESFLQLNQYKLYDKIGQGSYGLVKLAYSEEDSTHYAMKILSKKKLLRKAGLMTRGPKRGSTTSPLDRVYREIAVLKKLDHPNVVKLVEVLDDPLEDSLYLVFEWVELGAVLTVPTDTPLSEERAWHVFRDSLLGLEYLHYQHIIHSDLKPDNLLVDKDGRVQIADLGVCNEFDGNDASMSNISTPGTPAFRAPETLQTGQHSYNGRAVDVWALGATLYALVFGRVPFIADNVPALYERIRTEPLSFPAGASVSDRLRQLIGRMLDKDAAQRVTVPELKLDAWVTCDGAQPLPDEVTNCCALVDVTEDDISSVVTSIPKLDTLILIKNMLKKHSFQNPYAAKSAAGQSRTERFLRAGRSNSAPGAYHGIERQVSCDNLLPPVAELVAGTSERLVEEDAQDA